MRNFSVTSNFAFNRFRSRDLVQRSVRISLLRNTHDIRTSICDKFRSRDSGAQVRRKILTLDSRITRFCSALVHCYNEIWVSLTKILFSSRSLDHLIVVAHNQRRNFNIYIRMQAIESCGNKKSLTGSPRTICPLKWVNWYQMRTQHARALIGFLLAAAKYIFECIVCP
jgi:hypothetical protein